MSSEELHHATKPEERHADFSMLRATLVDLGRDVLKKIIWAMLCGTVAVSLVGFRIWLTQRDIATNFASMAHELSDLNDKVRQTNSDLSRTNERVQQMWYGGGWQQKLEAKHDAATP